MPALHSKLHVNLQKEAYHKFVFNKKMSGVGGGYFKLGVMHFSRATSGSL